MDKRARLLVRVRVNSGDMIFACYADARRAAFAFATRFDTPLYVAIRATRQRAY